MECPFCQSSNIQLHSVIHAAGTHRTHTEHHAVVNGQFVQGSSQGTQVSDLARHCAPPAPISPMPFVIAYGVGGMVTYGAATTCNVFESGCRVGMSVLAHLLYSWKQALVGLGIIGLGWLLMKGWHLQAKNNSIAKAEWRNTWFCHACGQSHLRQ